jgi:hypothetical protein
VKDLIITWPKSRALSSYERELRLTAASGNVINFRVPSTPKELCERCYVVHDGKVRGWSPIIEYADREDNKVLDPVTEEYWPAGIYIVRSPEWNPIKNAADKLKIKGFRDYRYIDRPCDVCEGHGDVWVSWESKPVRCGHCHGTGLVL